MNHGHTGHVRFLTSVQLGPDNGGGGGVRNDPGEAVGRSASAVSGGRLHGRKDAIAGEERDAGTQNPESRI